jgi:hypothetical protein
MSTSSLYDKAVRLCDEEAEKKMDERLEAFNRNKEKRVTRMAEQEAQLIEKEAEQMQTILTSKELDQLLERSRWALARVIAENIARGLKDVSEMLRTSMYQGDVANQVRKVAFEMAKERKSLEIKKSTILAYAMLAKARLKDIVANVFRRT